MKIVLTFFALITFQSTTYAVHLDITAGYEKKVCQNFFRTALSENTVDQWKIIKSIADDNGLPVWHTGHLVLKPATLEYFVKEPFLFSSFDIDNDGKDEFVLSNQAWLSGRPSTYYRVLDEPIPLDGTYREKWEKIYEMKGVYSNSPFPYSEDGIYMTDISSFKFSGTYYLVLKDFWFGQRDFINRSSILIAKYSNDMKEEFIDRGIITSSLENICKFQYVR